MVMPTSLSDAVEKCIKSNPRIENALRCVGSEIGAVLNSMDAKMGNMDQRINTIAKDILGINQTLTVNHQSISAVQNDVKRVAKQNDTIIERFDRLHEELQRRQ